MIENILILDTETTGLDPKKETTIEIGVILYNIEHKAVLQCLSTLLPCTANPVEHINKISVASTNLNYHKDSAIALFKNMVASAQAIVAHNAPFDKGFIDELFKDEIKLPWICTRDTFKWPVRPARRRLQDFCEAMGVPYVDAHRALTDCNLIVKCFSKIEDLYFRFNGHNPVSQNGIFTLAEMEGKN